MAGLGHNRGPVLGATGWQRHCWQRARAELLGPRLPVEIIRTRVACAKALGLDYKTYAGVRATTGRDLMAFLYSSNALGVFRNGQPVPVARALQVSASAADRHLGTSPGIDADRLGAAIGAISARTIPAFGSSWRDMRDDLKRWLRDQHLPGDAVLMIGETDHERELMAAGGLAGFVTGTSFFEEHAHAI